jgi:hypothetical protein
MQQPTPQRASARSQQTPGSPICGYYLRAAHGPHNQDTHRPARRPSRSLRYPRSPPRSQSQSYDPPCPRSVHSVNVVFAARGSPTTAPLKCRTDPPGGRLARRDRAARPIQPGLAAAASASSILSVARLPGYPGFWGPMLQVLGWTAGAGCSAAARAEPPS